MMQQHSGRLTSYFREVRAELKKVNWPTRQQTFYYTLTVIGACAFAVVFLGGLDTLFVYILNTFVLR